MWLFTFFLFCDIIHLSDIMEKKEIMEKIKLPINKNNLMIIAFVISNTINGLLLRIITLKSGLRLSAIMVDAGTLLFVGLLSLFIKKNKRREKYLFIMTILATLVCLINSMYYHYYNSFTSISLLATAVFVKDVSNAVFEVVLKPIDFIYLWCPLFIYLYYRKLKNKSDNNKDNKKSALLLSILAFLFLGISILLMPSNALSRLYKLWNRESVVLNFGPYVYQLDDTIQSLTPRIGTIFGHDTALRKVKEYYENNDHTKKDNQYTNIFAGKNIIVIHAESIQSFAMNLSFNNKDVTPNLNKLAEEGIFFNNFYSEVGVGTSSDAEFTFNTSLMPSTRGTVFVNYFNRDYIAIPQLLRNKGYYTYSMHANNKDFWNRDTMHKTLGYNKFYSKEYYNIDETIGLGLSDKSFFSQSVEIMKKEKEEHKEPFYTLLIMLSNHTPFSDLELMDEFQTTATVEIDGETITREYMNNTKIGNYLRSVHYADQAIGDLISNLDESGLLDNSILVIYGDHDARLDYDEFNLLYNYDPVADTIKSEEDDGYHKFNEYEYELNRKVPFIIWTKNGEYKKKIDIPTGMIDVLPTLGNMLGINSKYELGTDIMNITNGDNTVVFTDGSFVTSKLYYYAPKGEIYSLNNEPITEEYINLRVNHSAEIIDISNDIIYYDLIKELEKK